MLSMPLAAGGCWNVMEIGEEQEGCCCRCMVLVLEGVPDKHQVKAMRGAHYSFELRTFTRIWAFLLAAK